MKRNNTLKKTIILSTLLLWGLTLNVGNTYAIDWQSIKDKTASITASVKEKLGQWKDKFVARYNQMKASYNEKFTEFKKSTLEKYNASKSKLLALKEKYYNTNDKEEKEKIKQEFNKEKENLINIVNSYRKWKTEISYSYKAEKKAYNIIYSIQNEYNSCVEDGKDVNECSTTAEKKYNDTIDKLQGYKTKYANDPTKLIIVNSMLWVFNKEKSNLLKVIKPEETSSSTTVEQTEDEQRKELEGVLDKLLR